MNSAIFFQEGTEWKRRGRHGGEGDSQTSFTAKCYFCIGTYMCIMCRHCDIYHLGQANLCCAV